jgi:magnesium-transporting ATPase (P-type)
VSSPIETVAPTPWHHLTPDLTLERLGIGPKGLSIDEARRRLGQVGPNRLPEPKARGPLIRLLAQFHNLLIYVLLVAAVVTLILQHWIDSGVILGVVVVNAVIGFLQEGKAEDALKAIRAMLSPSAMAWRNGRLVTLDAAELVPGDLVQLQPGDRVPADLRLTRAKGLQVDEAALTGESMPVEKGGRGPAPRDPPGGPPLHGLFRDPGDPGPGHRRGGGHRRGHRDRPH